MKTNLKKNLKAKLFKQEKDMSYFYFKGIKIYESYKDFVWYVGHYTMKEKKTMYKTINTGKDRIKIIKGDIKSYEQYHG